jgi:anaerobic selenocysteine-containing dehydrogenase
MPEVVCEHATYGYARLSRPEQQLELGVTGSGRELRVVKGQGETITHPAVCCGCAQQCGVLVHVRDGRVMSISGDRFHPTSAGFVCPKGSNAHVLHDDGSRVHRPLKREGPRGRNRWREISWEQALEEIADRLAELAEVSGPETVAYSFGTLHGSDWGIGERFMNLFGSPNSVGQDKVCYGPHALGESLTYGFGPTFFTYPVPGKTRCIVVWGMRPSASMPLLWRQILRARRQGARLIVVDPERTREARHADVWIRSRPGSDVLLALSIINHVIREGLYDESFIANETIGFEDLRRRTAEYSDAMVAKETWADIRDIAHAARLIADGPTVIHGGNGLCQSGTMAVQAGRALGCLVAITGNLGLEGGHSLAGPPRDIVANGDAVLVDALPAVQRRKRLGADIFPHIGSGYGELNASMSRAWGKKHILSWLATGHEPSLWKAIVDQDPYPVRALIVQHHNPLGAAANARRVAAALTSENLELLVVHDLFVNATSRLADYLLPAAHWLEKPFYSAGYGYMAFAGDYVEAKPAPVAAAFEHRSDYDLWRDLGHRLGQADYWPATAEEFWSDLLRPAGLNFPSVCAHRGPLLGAEARSGRKPAHAVPRSYGTPSGKVELRSSLLEAWGLDPLPYFEIPGIFRDADHEYPLILTTGGRLIEGFHQNAQQMPGYRRKFPEPVARLNPLTAKEARIRAGSLMLIETPVGSVRQRASLTEDLPPGVVHADRWWYPERATDADDPFGFWETNINVCTDDALGSCDPVMGSWLLRGLPCRVVPVAPTTAVAPTPTR